MKSIKFEHYTMMNNKENYIYNFNILNFYNNNNNNIKENDSINIYFIKFNFLYFSSYLHYFHFLDFLKIMQ